MRALGSVFVVLLLAWPAWANGEGTRIPCQPRGDVIKYLAGQYGEVPTALGVVNTGALLEVFTAKDGLTWSVVVTSPDGEISCLVAAGEGWRRLEEVKRGEPL